MIIKGMNTGDTIIIYSSNDGYTDILMKKGPFPLRATYLGYCPDNCCCLVAWAHGEIFYNYAEHLSSFRTKLHIPDNFKDGYGCWVVENTYCESAYFNEQQKCNKCLKPAPHMDTSGKEFVCLTCMAIDNL